MDPEKVKQAAERFAAIGENDQAFQQGFDAGTENLKIIGAIRELLAVTMMRNSLPSNFAQQAVNQMIVDGANCASRIFRSYLSDEGTES